MFSHLDRLKLLQPVDYSDKKLRKLLKLIASAPDHAPIDCLWYQCDTYSIKAQSEMLLNEQDHASASKSGVLVWGFFK